MYRSVARRSGGKLQRFWEQEIAAEACPPGGAERKRTQRRAPCTGHVGFLQRFAASSFSSALQRTMAKRKSDSPPPGRKWHGQIARPGLLCPMLSALRTGDQAHPPRPGTKEQIGVSMLPGGRSISTCRTGRRRCTSVPAEFTGNQCRGITHAGCHGRIPGR